MRKKIIIILSCILAALLIIFGVLAVSSIKGTKDDASKDTIKDEKITPRDIDLIIDDSSDENADDTDTEEGTEGNDIPDAEDDTTAKVDKKGILIAIDPGHQKNGNSAQEPIGPGASETKAKVTGGAAGVSTGVPEYQLALDISLKLKEELSNRGYDILMTRESNDVDLSNARRAEMANNANADAFIRIHGNSFNSQSATGALALAPSATNPYVSNIAGDSIKLSEDVLKAYCNATGFTNKGVNQNDSMSGINWCKIPVTILELGFMSNPNEDMKMQDPAMQVKMVSGIADGIDTYFQ